ncbi:hypothetical protein IWQ61_002131 [Dispira simplex]|nr:hypothetical protein IWQ61_002131 [Dispira simplex]
MRHISVVGYIVQAVGLVLSVGGLYGTIKYKARPVLAFGVYLWLGVLLSIIGFCAMFALSLFPKGRAKLCNAITHHPEVDYPYESCLNDFWKLALVAFPVLLAALALKVYLTLVPWSFYRKLQSGDGLLDEPERAQYSAIVDHEEV